VNRDQKFLTGLALGAIPFGVALMFLLTAVFGAVVMPFIPVVLGAIMAVVAVRLRRTRAPG
jgi:hypothetical protein